MMQKNAKKKYKKAIHTNVSCFLGHLSLFVKTKVLLPEIYKHIMIQNDWPESSILANFDQKLIQI